MASGCVIVYHGKRGDVYRLKYTDARGKQVMETLGPAKSKQRPDGWTAKQAEKELGKRIAAVEDNGYERPKPLTFRAYAERWFDEGAGKWKWQLSTISEYKTVRRRLVATFGAMKLGEVRPRHVADYVASLTHDGYSASVVHRDVAVLSKMFKSAKAAELVASNPVEGVERPSLPRFRPHILKPEEIRAILQAFTDVRARVLFLTLELAGIRRHEAELLCWRDVDLIENVLHVRKSKSEAGVRSIALSPQLAEELWQLRRVSAFAGDDEYVFAHPERGVRLDADWFKQELKAAMAAAGVERFPEWTHRDAAGRRRGGFRAFHDNRHTSITNDARSASPIAVKVKAGHSSLSTTEKYVHLAGTEFREEAAALEQRLLGGLSTAPSTDLTSPDVMEDDAASLHEPQRT
jgi:integrase